MRNISSRLLLLVITLWPLAPAWPADKVSVAVYPIKAVGGVGRAVTSNLTALLAAELAQSPKLLVVKEDMAKVLLGRQAAGRSDACDSVFCQAEIGKVVRKLVVAELLSLGPRYILTLSVVDVPTGNVDFSGQVECACADDQMDQLAALAGNRLREYFGETGLPAVKPIRKSAAFPRGSRPPAAEIAYLTSPEDAETMRQLDKIFQAVAIDPAAEQTALDQGQFYALKMKGAKPDKYYVSGMIAASPAVVWYALSDVDHYDQFLPRSLSVSVVENKPGKAVIQVVSNIRVVTTKLYFDEAAQKMFWKELEDSITGGLDAGVSRVLKVEPLDDQRAKLIIVQQGGRFLHFDSSLNEMEDLLQAFKRRAESLPK